MTKTEALQELYIETVVKLHKLEHNYNYERECRERTANSLHETNNKLDQLRQENTAMKREIISMKKKVVK